MKKESLSMQSRNIVFTGKDQVELYTEAVREPGPGEVLIKAKKTLISTGTEGICLSHLFAPGTHWDKWVKYPFHPGYNMVGQVVAVGSDVEGIHEGDRFALRKPHQEYVTVPTSELYAVPDGVSDEEAACIGLAAIVQIEVRRAELTLGDTGTPSEQRLTGDVVTKGLTIVGAHDSNPPAVSTDHAYWSKQRMVELFFTYLLRGDMRVSDLVTHSYSPLDAAETYRILREERMTIMGVLFDWTQL